MIFPCSLMSIGMFDVWIFWDFNSIFHGIETLWNEFAGFLLVSLPCVWLDHSSISNVYWFDSICMVFFPLSMVRSMVSPMHFMVIVFHHVHQRRWDFTMFPARLNPESSHTWICIGSAYNLCKSQTRGYSIYSCIF